MYNHDVLEPSRMVDTGTPVKIDNSIWRSNGFWCSFRRQKKEYVEENAKIIMNNNTEPKAACAGSSTSFGFPAHLARAS